MSTLDAVMPLFYYACFLFVAGMIYAHELWYHPRPKSRGAHAAGRGKQKHA